MSRGAERRRRRAIRGALFVSVVACATLLAPTGAADAHPLGNFTINRFARIELSAETVRVYYVLDLAEIPAFQQRAALKSDRAGFLRDQVDDIADDLELEVDGAPVRLRATTTGLDQPDGQGGLFTLRVSVIYTGTLPPATGGADQRLSFADRNDPGRVGWREIVAVARGDTEIVSSDVPEDDVSNELRTYPDGQVTTPLVRRTATIEFSPGSQTVDPEALPRSSAAPARTGDRLSELITRRDIGAGALVAMLGVAFLVGAGHSLLPGHGKTVMGAYLVGTKGRPIDALFLGLIVSVMHSLGVLVLGLILYRVNRAIALERLYPVLTVASGVVAACFGVWLLLTRRRRLHARRAAHALAHDHDHDHDQSTHTTPGPSTTTSTTTTTGRSAC